MIETLYDESNQLLERDFLFIFLMKNNNSKLLDCVLMIFFYKIDELEFMNSK